jgi:hypothetical protein
MWQESSKGKYTSGKEVSGRRDKGEEYTSDTPQRKTTLRKQEESMSRLPCQFSKIENIREVCL